MPSYRLYHLDGAGKVATAEWIEAVDDEAAVAVATERSRERRCELWHGERLVARIAPKA